MDHFPTAGELTYRRTLLSLNFPFAIPSNPHGYGLAFKETVQNFSSFDEKIIVLWRCQSGPLCSHRLHQPLWNSISWCRDFSLWTERGTDKSVYSRAFSPSVQRREQEGQSLVVHSFTDEKPEGFSFTFQFQFPTGVCHTSSLFIELFPSLYLRVQRVQKSRREQSIKEGSRGVLSWWKPRELQPPSQPPWGKYFLALQFEWTHDRYLLVASSD